MPSRQTTHFTYGVIKAEVDYAKRTITTNCAHSIKPIKKQFVVQHGLDEDPPIVGQFFEVFTAGIQAVGGGGVGSQRSLESLLTTLRSLVKRLIKAGITDAAGQSLTAEACEDVLSADPGRASSEIAWVAAAVRAAGRLDSESLAGEIERIPLSPRPEPNKKEPYSKGDGEAIRDAAKLIIDKSVEQFKVDLGRLGLDVTGRKFMEVTAEQIIEASRKRSPKAIKRQMPATVAELKEWEDEEIFDHLVVNGPGPLSNKRLGNKGRCKDIGDRVYPGAAELTAWAVTHCVADLRGFNFGTIVGVSADDVEYVGDDELLVSYGKARSHQRQRIPHLAQGLNTLGGLLQYMDVRTAVQRHHFAKTGSSAAQNYYLRASTGVVLDVNITNKIPRSSGAWKKALQQFASDTQIETISFQKLRLWCVAEGQQTSTFHKPKFQSDRTHQDYLAGCLVDTAFHELATAAADEMVDEAFKALSPERQLTLKTGLENESLVELGHSVCATGQTLPDDDTKRCLQGPLACLTCPSGFRTTAEIPGLLALNKLATQLVATHPDDFEAALLLEATKKILKKFPKALVKAARKDLDPVTYSLMSNLYAAHRHPQENPNV